MSDPSRVTKRRAFTLIEVLIAAFLLLLMLGILTRFFQIAYRISNEELERNSVEASLLNLTSKFERDLSVGAAPGLSVSSDRESVLIHPVVLTDVGTVAYQDKLIFWTYNSTDEILRRRETDSYSGFAFDGTPYRASQVDLAGLTASTEFQDSLRFTGISQFEITTNPEVPAPFIGSPIVLTLKARLNQSRKELELTKVVNLRNHG
jgi:type II secretory pathway pseudopilin PulG